MVVESTGGKGQKQDAPKEQPAEVSPKPTASPSPVPGWQRAISRVIGASLLFYLISRFVPCGRPNHYSLIDDSWIQVFHKAFVEHWQFGRDIVFTMGPWGFLYGGYLPATHLISLAVWTVLAVVFWWAGIRVAFACFRNQLAAWLWLTVFSAVSGLTIFLNLDARMTAFILFLLLIHFFVEDRPFTTLQASLAVSLALFGLVKFSLLIVGGVTVFVIAVDVVWRHRRFPWLLAVYGASVLVFWSLAGQHWNSFIPFLVNSWHVASGYTDAMCVTQATEGRDVGLFLTATALLGAVAGYATWKRHRHFAILPLAAMAFLGFSAFKYGYVRHDGHEVAATMQLLLAAMACQVMAWPSAGNKKWMFRSAILLPMVFILLLNSAVLGRYAGQGFCQSLVQTFGIQTLAAPFGLLRVSTDQVYEEYLAPIKSEFELPDIDGNADIYPWNQAALLAHGLSYRPRPVIQSYSAYTPELAEMNAAFLRGASAPDNILFQLSPIDDHFPALEDGRSWPELLTRYDVITNTNLSVPLLLKRSASPRHYQKVFLQEAALTFGRPVMLPAVADGPVWAEIEINKSLAGDIVSLLYKVPALRLTVALGDGRQNSFRLIPGMARGGFVVSPFIGDQKTFSLLTTQEGFRTLGSWEVRSIMISVDDNDGKSSSYWTPQRIRFYRLEYFEPGQESKPAFP